MGSPTRLVVLTSGTDLGVGCDAAPPWFVLAACCNQLSACRSAPILQIVWLGIVHGLGTGGEIAIVARGLPAIESRSAVEASRRCWRRFVPVSRLRRGRASHGSGVRRFRHDQDPSAPATAGKRERAPVAAQSPATRSRCG